MAEAPGAPASRDAERATLSRREFLVLAGALAPSIAAATCAAEPAGAGPILDIHQHIHNNRSVAALLEHQRVHAVTKTVILPAAGWLLSVIRGNDDSERLHRERPREYVYFASADPVEADAIPTLRRYAGRGAAGFGEMKFQVAIDSPEMHRVYALAGELKLPVLAHIGGKHNTGIERFESILKAYPKVNFIGHATGWWANVSRDPAPGVGYPTGPVTPGGLTDRLLGDYANLFGDLSAKSGLGALTRDEAFASGFVDRHARKLIWGSDCPCQDGRGAGLEGKRCIAADGLAALRRLVRDPAKLRRILYDNGAELLRV